MINIANAILNIFNTQCRNGEARRVYMSYNIITKTIEECYVKCDICGKEKIIGENLGWDSRMNKTLANGYTFKDESGVFKNYCKDCKTL